MTSYVIVGDPDRSRFDVVRDCIEGAFQFEVVQADTFERVMSQYGERGEDVKLILLTDRLPQSLSLPRNFQAIQLAPLTMGTRARALAGYVHDAIPADFSPSLSPLQLLVPFPGDDKARESFLERMRGNFFSFILPDVNLDDDALLREQVRSLDRQHDLLKGKNKLGRIVGGFFSGEVTVSRLKSGLSGASVFRLTVAGKSGDYILKLDSEAWKLKIEASRHLAVAAGIPGFRQSKTNLEAPRESAPAENRVVGAVGWYGICYKFVGGGAFGPVLDLQKALTVPADRLNLPARLATAPGRSGADEFRIARMRQLLEWLKYTWCTKPELVTRSAGRWWEPSDGPADSYETFPPYRLSARSKGGMLGFFESPDAAIGARLMPDEWDRFSKIVRRFVQCDRAAFEASGLDREISMVRSPAHGDLNSNNVLFCVELEDPIFLIDFPMYQQSGHAMQDFARLEAEVKFALMDRQEEPGLPGLDYTPTQFALWREMESHLRESWEETRVWASAGLQHNVQLTLRLIQSIRSAAREVQHQSEPGAAAPPPFLEEYTAALFFHTLRAITYTSLSPFKRILAVVSAAGLLKELGFTLKP